MQLSSHAGIVVHSKCMSNIGRFQSEAIVKRQREKESNTETETDRERGR